MSELMEIRVIPPYSARDLYQRNTIEPATFKAGETVVYLKSAAHEAKIAKIRRQLESSQRRESQWAPVAVGLCSGAAIVGLVATALWVAK